MERLPGDKGGLLEIEDAVDDVADFAEPAERVEVRHTGICRVVARPDDAERDSVHPNPAGRVLNGQRARHGGQAALGEGRQGGGPLAVGIVHQAGADVDDMAAALRHHLDDDALGQMEEPGQVHRGHQDVVVKCVLSEGLADEHPHVVDQAVDSSETIDRLFDHVVSRLPFGDVTPYREVAVLVGRFNGARSGDDGIALSPESRHESCTNALGTTRDDRYPPCRR